MVTKFTNKFDHQERQLNHQVNLIAKKTLLKSKNNVLLVFVLYPSAFITCHWFDYEKKTNFTKLKKNLSL